MKPTRFEQCPGSYKPALQTAECPECGRVFDPADLVGYDLRLVPAHPVLGPSTDEEPRT